MTYAADWASALADVKAAGAAVSFSTSTGSAYDPTSGMVTGGAPGTATGYAMRVKGNPVRYAALGLVLMESPTLFFVPDVYGVLPTLDSSVSWNGATYNVKDLDPVAPDGVAICAHIIVAR